jgi:AraC-like DNA-binding protein
MPGTVDEEYFPRHIAESFVRDDLKVIRTGVPLINRVAVWYNEQRILDWFVKCKFPLRDHRGKIAGLIVSIQNYDGIRDAQTPFSEVSRAIDYIRENSRERISVPKLAANSGVSPRHLNRRFQSAFGVSAQAFLAKTRIQATIDALLRTAKPISEIALEFGFFDQSAFTRQFRENTGFTPKQFRQLHMLKPSL